jgi:acyl-ACP thioesterase
MTEKLFCQEYTVRPDEADRSGYCTLRTLCNFFQDSAHRHANSLGFGYEDMAREKKAWVLSRLYLSITRPPRFAETVTLETWPTGIDRLFALRDFRVMDNSGNPLALGTSAWLILQVETRRIMRMTEQFEEFGKNPRALPKALSKIEPINTDGAILKNLDVRFRDIDVNQHVNNVSFIEWITETLPLDLLEAAYCCELEINFFKEAFYGDTVISRSAPVAAHQFYHSLARPNAEELARARTVWQDTAALNKA